MARREHNRSEELLRRARTPQQEWTLARELKQLLHSSGVAAAVDARTGGKCYYPDCDGKIISYPHAVKADAGGVHEPINRGGVCCVHGEAMHHGNDPHGHARMFLQQWLQRWYGEREGLSPADWWTRAVRPGASAREGPLCS